MPTINVPLDRIQPNPWQTRIRLEPDHVLPLAEDIARNGLLHPPAGRLVNEHGELADYGGNEAWRIAQALESDAAFYIQLAVGHNRVAAYDVLAYGPAHKFPELEGHVAGIEPDPGRYGTIPVQVAPYSDQQMAQLAWAENFQRKALTPLEEAKAIQRVVDDFAWTQQEAADHFGLARATVANKLRLLQLPEDVQGSLHQGRLSERAAGALLPIYSLPADVRDRVRKHEVPHYTEEHLVEQAANGATSDELRQLVTRSIQSATELLDGYDFPLDQEVAAGVEGVRSPACDECPVLVRYGDEKRCGYPDCHKLKAAWWREHRLAQAAEATGLRVSDRDRWALTFFEDSNWVQNKAFGAQIIEAGCPSARLALCWQPYAAKHDRDMCAVDGVPDVVYACESTGGCACLSKLKNEAVAEPDPQKQAAKIAEKEAKERWQREVQQPLTNRLARALESMSPDAWRLATETLLYGLSSDTEWSVYCDILANRLVDRKTPINAHENLDKHRRDLLRWASAARLPEPDPAQDLRRRLDRVKVWAEGLAENYPSVEQLQGNLDNLEQLVSDFWDVASDLAPNGEPGDHEKSDPLDYFLAEVEDLQDLLKQLLPIVQRQDLKLIDFYEHMPILLSTAPDAIDALLANNPMPTALLEYALAVAAWRDDDHRWQVLLDLVAPVVDEAMCDECNDLLPTSDLITCSCSTRCCEACYVELGHRNHDNNPTNAALREIMDGFNQS